MERGTKNALLEAFSQKQTELYKMMEDVLDLIDVKDRKIEILESEAEELENDVLTLRAHGREMDDLMEEE